MPVANWWAISNTNSTPPPGHQRPALRGDKDAYTAALKGGALTGEQNQNVIRISKRLALDAFFNQVMIEEMDPDAVVERKRGMFINPMSS